LGFKVKAVLSSVGKNLFVVLLRCQDFETRNFGDITTLSVCLVFQAKLREKIEYNDLEGEETISSAPALKLARCDPYLHGPTPVIAMQYRTSEDMIHACQAFTQEMMAWQSQQTQVCIYLDHFITPVIIVIIIISFNGLVPCSTVKEI